MMANGRSWYTLIRGGNALKSLSRGAMLSLSKDIRILLKGVGGKRQPGHASGNVVLKQGTLVRFKQKSFDALSRKEKQFPVRQFQQLGSRCLVLLEVKGDVGECCDRK